MKTKAQRQARKKARNGQKERYAAKRYLRTRVSVEQTRLIRQAYETQRRETEQK